MQPVHQPREAGLGVQGSPGGGSAQVSLAGGWGLPSCRGSMTHLLLIVPKTECRWGAGPISRGLLACLLEIASWGGGRACIQSTHGLYFQSLAVVGWW